MPFLRSIRRGRAPALLLAAGVAALLAGCDTAKPRFMTDVMAPSGSTPEQIRAFCTQLGDEAANWNQVAGDPIGPSLRARNETFARCMARHQLTP
jgi:hypothetical protein